MIGTAKNNRENYLRKFFSTQENKTRVKFNPGISASLLLSSTGPCILLVMIPQPQTPWHLALFLSFDFQAASISKVA